MPNVIRVAPSILLFLLAAWSAAAFADPPRHAPAHGWRQKHDPYYIGYTGGHWDHDYGILAGRCNREAVATVLGGVIGGVIGSKIGDRDNRPVAIIIGAAAGALVGNKIGRELDEADRSCFGHALEVGKSGQKVTWANEETGVQYEMIPGATNDEYGDMCREYTLRAVSGDRKSIRRGTACETERGVWSVVESAKT